MLFHNIFRLKGICKNRTMVVRLCHNSPLCPIPDVEKMTLVKTINKSIDKSNNLHLESPIHVKIMPVDVNNIEKHDTVTMQIYSKGCKDTADFQLKQSTKSLELVNTKCAELSDVCVIRLPYHLNVSVTTREEANVEIEKLYLENFSVQSANGSVLMKDIQAKEIQVSSETGPISCKGKLQADNIDLKTGESAGITCNNVIANTLTISTNSGPICVSSCYSTNSHFTTALGDINLDHLHKTTNIDIIQQGNLHVSGLNGNIHASIKSGDVFLHISKLAADSNIFIHEKGKVDLRMSEKLDESTIITLIAEKIELDSDIESKGVLAVEPQGQRFNYPSDSEKGKNELVVECRNGVISLKKSESPFFIPKCPDL